MPPTFASILCRPAVMGILNCTPDSFFDGAAMARLDTEARIKKGLRLLAEGAAVIDIGGESTRPGAAPVCAAEEIARVVPVIRGLRAQTSAPISIDTYKAETAAAALAAGADIINDIYAGDPASGGDEEMFAVARRYHAPIILMHSHGQPPTMQDAPFYADVVAEVRDYLHGRAAAARAAGLEAAVDPGFGFGKTAADNWKLFRALPSLCEEFHAAALPVLIGVSNKSMFGGTADSRGEKSAAAAAEAAAMGVDILRVHDVAAALEHIAAL